MSIIVITGGMFGGKTDLLIYYVDQAMYAKKKVQVFKPDIDNRYDEIAVSAHNGQKVQAIPITSAREILGLIYDDTDLIAIDEAQFLDSEITEVVENLADRGFDLVVAGLNLDFRGEPFGSMADLMVHADRVKTVRARCAVCGKKASRTQRIINGKPAPRSSPLILVGGTESYEARCREHHEVPDD